MSIYSTTSADNRPIYNINWTSKTLFIEYTYVAHHASPLLLEHRGSCIFFSLGFLSIINFISVNLFSICTRHSKRCIPANSPPASLILPSKVNTVIIGKSAQHEKESMTFIISQPNGQSQFKSTKWSNAPQDCFFLSVKNYWC